MIETTGFEGKTLYSFRLDSELARQLKIEALTENRSFSNYVERLLMNHPSRVGGNSKAKELLNPKS